MLADRTGDRPLEDLLGDQVGDVLGVVLDPVLGQVPAADPDPGVDTALQDPAVQGRPLAFEVRQRPLELDRDARLAGQRVPAPAQLLGQERSHPAGLVHHHHPVGDRGAADEEGGEDADRDQEQGKAGGGEPEGDRAHPHQVLPLRDDPDAPSPHPSPSSHPGPP